MKRTIVRVRLVGPILAGMMAAHTCFAATFTKIAAGPQLMPLARAAVDPGGLVVAATKTGLLVGNGGATTPINLSANGYVLGTFGNHYEPVETSSGQIVFVGTHATGPIPCSSPLAGVYRIATGGGPITSLYEECPNFNAPYIGGNNSSLSMSPNGIVAFSNMTSLQGAVFRGSMNGPSSKLLCALSGNFSAAFPTAVNDSGRVVADFEYGPNLMRAVLAYDAPQGCNGPGTTPPYTAGLKASVTTMNVFATSVAIGPSGKVAFSTGSEIDVVTPVPFGAAQPVAKVVADTSGSYCGFGEVAILDDDSVIFEGRLKGQPGCNMVSTATEDGLFDGPTPATDTIVARDDPALGSLRHFSDIVLGHVVGDGSRLSFTLTTPMAAKPGHRALPTISVWRMDDPKPCGKKGQPCCHGPRPGVPLSAGALPPWCGNLEGTCVGNVCRCGGLNQRCCEPGGTCGSGLSCSNLLCLVPANGTQACQQCGAKRTSCQNGCKLDPAHVAHCDCLCEATYCDCRKACGDLACQFPSCAGK
jgi:hypothetical protein